jgi:hypothetical protein
VGIQENPLQVITATDAVAIWQLIRGFNNLKKNKSLN